MIPVTHFYALHGLSDRVRQSIMNEFAAVGGKHLVLTDHCVAQIMTDTAFAQKLKADMRVRNMRLKSPISLMSIRLRSMSAAGCPSMKARRT